MKMIRFYVLLLFVGVIQGFGDDQHWIQKQLLQMMSKDDNEQGEQVDKEKEKEVNKEVNVKIHQKPSAKSINNIDYIFGGYNLFRSNPLTWEDSFDPGFTGRLIFEPSYEKEKLTADNRYNVPDNVQVQVKKGCKYSFDSKVIKTLDDLKRYLSDYVGLNLASHFELTPWAFTASPEFNSIQNSMQQRMYQYVFSNTQSNSKLPTFSEAFIQAVNELPTQYDPAAYIDFIDNFGTHYLKQMDLGSRMGYAYSMAPEQMQTVKGERFIPKWLDEDLEQAATITAQVIKNVIQTQILPKNASSKAFTDLTKIAAQTFQIEIGRQSKSENSTEWMLETEDEPMPVRYKLGSIADLLEEGRIELQETETVKLAKNMRKAYQDYCKMLSIENERQGNCQPEHDQIKEWFQQREICIDFFEQCDYKGQHQYLCGNRNPVQNVGINMPEVTASSVKFYSEKTVIIGTNIFTMEYDQSAVLTAFHNDYFFFQNSEPCFVNQELSADTRVRVFITDSTKCLVLLLWNYCPGYAIRYYTSVICDSFDVAENFKAAVNEVGNCEVALLDIRYPQTTPLRMCIFKQSKFSGERTCFTSDTAEQYYGLSFVSMLIDEEEVVIHKAMPASIKVEFDIDEENMEAVAEEGEEENETVQNEEQAKK